MTTTLHVPAAAGTTPPDTAQVAPAPRRTETPPEPPRAAIRTVGPLAAAARATALLGLLLVGFFGYLSLLSPVQQDRYQQGVYKTFAGQLAVAVAPIDGIIPAGVPVAVLQIPRLGLTQVVLEGTDSGTLMNGPGHRRDTVLPGQAGVSVLLGRSGLFGAPFAKIGTLAVGDEIMVTTGQGPSTFAVTGVRDSTQTIPAPTAAAGKLTLSTAAPPLAPDRSLLVSADLTSGVLPGAPGTRVIGEQERSLTGDTSAVLPLMLWSQALLLVALGTSYLYVRWNRWSAYLICTPVLLGVLWNVYENAARLLPNTM